MSPKEIRKQQELIEKLVETPLGVGSGDSLLEAKGWKEIVEEIPGDERKGFVAIALENMRGALAEAKEGRFLFEDSQSINVGNWEKFGFPVISMVAENLVTPELVAVQPLQGPSGNVFYLDYVVGQTKGDIKKGDPIWQARAGHGPHITHSSEEVRNEQVAIGTGAASYEGTLAYTPLRPGTIEITVGNESYTDDGNGNMVASGALVSGGIDYQTGQIELTFDTGSEPSAGEVISATYHWNSEGSTQLPQVNFQITSSPIYARRHALRGRWTFEAEQMLMALHGLKAEGNIAAAISAEIQFEIDRLILNRLWNLAGAGNNTWNATPASSNISFTEHKLSFVDAINELSMFIYRATSRVMANWVMVGVQGAAILINHPLFEPATSKAEVDGVTFLGTLNRQYKVFVDPHTAPDEYLVGYKGDNFMRTGFIFAPWLMLYSTQTIALDDFVHRKGFASNFGWKAVNSKYYAKGKILNYPINFGGGV